MLHTSKYVYFTNATSSSLAAERAINERWDIFLQVMIPSIPGWAEVPYDKYFHIYVVYCLFWSFIVCAELRRCSMLNSKELSATLLFETECSYPRFNFFKRFAIIPLPYQNRISNGSVICMTSSFGTKRCSKLFKVKYPYLVLMLSLLISIS